MIINKHVNNKNQTTKTKQKQTEKREILKENANIYQNIHLVF